MLIVNPDSIPLNAKLYIHATDTCYGFAARYNDNEALELIQKLKGRKTEKPFSLLFASIEMLEKYCELNKEQKEFILQQKEPSSFIIKKKEILKNYFPPEPNISARIENDKFPVKLSTALSSPITSTSVNRSEKAPLYSSQEIMNEFDEADDKVILIDSGNIEKIPPSAIWDLTNKEFIRIR